MSALLRAICLLEISLACFTITDVSLVEGDSAGNPVTTGLRYSGDIYNPPAPGCNRIPCGLGTNNAPEFPRFYVNAGTNKISLNIRLENTSFSGRMGFEFRYGDNPQFPLGFRAFPLGTEIPIVRNADQVSLSTTFGLSPSYTANATIQAYFITDEPGFGRRNYTVFYQCVDIVVSGASALPAWGSDFGPNEQATFVADPTGTRGYECALDPTCQSYIPNTSDWAWLIVLCVLSFLVLVVCIIIAILCCCRRHPKTVVAPPPEPPPPHDDIVAPKELTPSTSKVSPYAHFAFSDPNDPPSKKGADSGSVGDRNTGSQGRHFHFHYEEAEPGDIKEDRPETVLRPGQDRPEIVLRP